MDNFKYDFEKECQDIVDEVSKKYQYNEDLKKVLGKVTKSIVMGKSFEYRQRFYNVLKTTPIYVLTESSEITPDELSEQMFGNLNPHIVDKEVDRGEYDKQKAAGSFCLNPIFDENLNIIGVKKYIFIDGFDTDKPLSSSKEKTYEIFETGINVSHLIHELGHAMASQENPCRIEDDILTIRLGACEMQSRITPLGNGKYESEGINISGLYIEEGLNTNFEEETLAKYLGVSIEEAKKLYGPILVPSNYQGSLSLITERFNNDQFRNDVEKWRLEGDRSGLTQLNSVFSKTNFYEHRDKLYKRDTSIAPDVEGNILVQKNRAFNDESLSERATQTLKELETDFFEDPTEMTPMDMLDNILKQFYNTGLKKYHLPLDKYGELVRIMATEGISLINQATIIKQQSRGIEDATK